MALDAPSGAAEGGAEGGLGSLRGAVAQGGLQVKSQKLSRRQKKLQKQQEQQRQLRQQKGGFSGAGPRGRAMPVAGVLGLPGWCEVRVLEDPAGAGEATAWLEESMNDPVLGVDLEWKPERRPGENNKVALLQLATERRALLLRTRLTELPPATAALLRRRSSVLTGFDFTCDAQKLKSAFGFDLYREANAVDLKALSQQMGYPHMGLARLCRYVLGREVAKSKRVATSNWEAPQLSASQVQYAALDAWVCGLMFRQLRAWQEPGGGGASLRDVRRGHGRAGRPGGTRQQRRRGRGPRQGLPRLRSLHLHPRKENRI